MTAADAELVERWNDALEAGGPSDALPNGVAYFRLKPVDLAHLLAIAERGLSERADVVAWLREKANGNSLGYDKGGLFADKIEIGAHVGAAKERTP